MLEDRVALPVPYDVWVITAHGRRRRRPERPALFVTQIDGLARWVAHGVVRPRREPVLAAVRRPCVTASGIRHLKAEVVFVGDDVCPRRGRPLPRAQDRYVFATVLTKAAESVEERQFRRLHDRLGV